MPQMPRPAVQRLSGAALPDKDGGEMIGVDTTVFAFLLFGSLLGCAGLFWALVVGTCRLLGVKL